MREVAEDVLTKRGERYLFGQSSDQASSGAVQVSAVLTEWSEACLHAFSPFLTSFGVGENYTFVHCACRS